jgi:hypothetical protein
MITAATGFNRMVVGAGFDEGERRELLVARAICAW